MKRVVRMGIELWERGTGCASGNWSILTQNLPKWSKISLSAQKLCYVIKSALTAQKHAPSAQKRDYLIKSRLPWIGTMAKWSKPGLSAQKLCYVIKPAANRSKAWSKRSKKSISDQKPITFFGSALSDQNQVYPLKNCAKWSNPRLSAQKSRTIHENCD